MELIWQGYQSKVKIHFATLSRGVGVWVFIEVYTCGIQISHGIEREFPRISPWINFQHIEWVGFDSGPN